MRYAIVLMVAVMFLSSNGHGQTPVLLGEQFQVNTSTTDDQNKPFVASDSLGRFMVVWIDRDDDEVFGQRFDSDGSPAGGEFVISSSSFIFRKNPVVDALDNGDFVVVWTGEDVFYPDNDYESIQGRRYDSLGNSLGLQFQINTYSTGEQGFRAFLGMVRVDLLWSGLVPDPSVHQIKGLS